MTGLVTVVGLGPAGPELLTRAAADALARGAPVYLRTARHPAAAAVRGATTFDAVYEAAGDLDEVYERIRDELVAAAARHGAVVYAVPGSPNVAERTVDLLRASVAAGDVAVEVLPALGFVDLAWERLGVDPVAAGARLVDGHRFAAEAAGERGPLLVAQVDTTAVLSEIKLAVGDPPPEPVTVLQRLGLPDERLAVVPWSELDRSVVPDHLTALWVPTLAAPVGAELVAFWELVRTLRERCPWDREQTHASLTRYLLEETYEVIEAIEALEPDPAVGADGGVAPGRYAALEEELGDLLFQVYFHATLAAEAGAFTIAEVAGGIHDKLVRRHPHVFGDVEADTAGQVVANWEQIKKQEKARASLMDGIAGGLPSLLHAAKVQRKAASVGFDWDGVEGPLAKVAEELEELGVDRSADELGDLLFAATNVARHLDVDPEAALRRATARFRDRFRAVEDLAVARGIDLAAADLATLDALWDEVKTGEP